MFGDDEAQVQYYARNRSELEDVWIRRSALRPGAGRRRYVPSWRTRGRRAADVTGALLYRAIGSMTGAADGRAGLLRRSPCRAAT